MGLKGKRSEHLYGTQEAKHRKQQCSERCWAAHLEATARRNLCRTIRLPKPWSPVPCICRHSLTKGFPRIATLNPQSHRTMFSQQVTGRYQEDKAIANVPPPLQGN